MYLFTFLFVTIALLQASAYTLFPSKLTNNVAAYTSRKNLGKFFLYTNKYPNGRIPVNIGDVEALKTGDYDSSLPTKFIIHGWRDSVDGEPNVFIRPALLKKLKCNVFAVDWEAASHQAYTIAATRNVFKVGEEVARFIEFLMKHTGLDRRNIHLIGHSLGSHISGWASKKMIYGRVSRITGLDVALPLFNYMQRHKRLNTESADFVEVYHTNGGMLGFKKSIGHVDFYANDGTSQPGCTNPISATVCAHIRVNELYSEIVSGVSVFLARPCRTQAEVELNKCTDRSPLITLSGVISTKQVFNKIYRFDTADTSPFSNVPANRRHFHI